MATTAVTYSYVYPFESAVIEQKAGPAMRLATSLEGTSDDLSRAMPSGTNAGRPVMSPGWAARFDSLHAPVVAL